MQPRKSYDETSVDKCRRNVEVQNASCRRRRPGTFHEHVRIHRIKHRASLQQRKMGSRKVVHTVGKSVGSQEWQESRPSQRRHDMDTSRELIYGEFVQISHHPIRKHVTREGVWSAVGGIQKWFKKHDDTFQTRSSPKRQVPTFAFLLMDCELEHTSLEEGEEDVGGMLTRRGKSISPRMEGSRARGREVEASEFLCISIHVHAFNIYIYICAHVNIYVCIYIYIHKCIVQF